jgi:hypothetical protein
MPEFTTVSVQEAQLRIIPGRQGRFINEYAEYIQQVPAGQAGRLRIGETENPLTIRRRLITAAKAMHIPLIIKRSRNDLYFWREDGTEEQPRTKRRYTRRNRRGKAGDYFPPQPFTEPEEFEQAVSEQTTVSDAV